MAQTLLQLIISRHSAGLAPTDYCRWRKSSLATSCRPAKRGRNRGSIAASPSLSCSVIGPIVGGLITDLLSWHWIFYVNLPIGAVGAVVIGRALKRRHRARSRRITISAPCC